MISHFLSKRIFNKEFLGIELQDVGKSFFVCNDGKEGFPVHEMLYNFLKLFDFLGLKSLWRLIANKGQEIWVLRDINIKIEPRERIAIAGPAGAGKSVLLNIILGITKPSTGNGVIHGKVYNLNNQFHFFEDELTCYENLLMMGDFFGIESRDRINAHIEEILNKSGMTGQRNFPMKYIDKRKQKLLGYFSCLIMDPSWLVIDQSIKFYDEEISETFKASLKEVLDKGCGLLATNTASDIIKEFCQRAIILEDGKLIDDGDFQSISDKYPDYFIREKNKNDDEEESYYLENIDTDLEDEELGETEEFRVGEKTLSKDERDRLIFIKLGITKLIDKIHTREYYAVGPDFGSMALWNENEYSATSNISIRDIIRQFNSKLELLQNELKARPKLEDFIKLDSNGNEHLEFTILDIDNIPHKKRITAVFHPNLAIVITKHFPYLAPGSYTREDIYRWTEECIWRELRPERFVPTAEQKN